MPRSRCQCPDRPTEQTDEIQTRALTRSGPSPPSRSSRAALDRPLTETPGNQPASGPGGGRLSVTSTSSHAPVRVTRNLAPAGSSDRAAMAGSSPRAPARAAARAASVHRACVPSTLTNHITVHVTRTRTGNAIAISAVTAPSSHPRCNRDRSRRRCSRCPQDIAGASERGLQRPGHHTREQMGNRRAMHHSPQHASETTSSDRPDGILGRRHAVLSRG